MCFVLFVSLDAKQQEFSDKIAELQSACERHQEKTSGYEKLLDSLDTKYRDSIAEKETLRTSLDESVFVNGELKLSIRTVENEKEMLSDQLKNKLERIEELSEDLKQLRSEQDGVRKSKVDIAIKLEEIASKDATLKVCLLTNTMWIFFCLVTRISLVRRVC